MNMYESIERKVHFIKAPCHQSMRTQGFQFGADDIKEHYDHTIDIKKFDGSVIEPGTKISICEGYNDLYKYVGNYLCDQKQIIATIGGDHSIAASTIAAFNEIYNDLAVVWVDAYPDLMEYGCGGLDQLVVSSLFGKINPPFFNCKKLLRPEQFVFFGLQDSDEIELIEGYSPFFTADKIKHFGIENITETIKEIIGNRPVYMSIDTKVFDKTIAPSTEPVTENGLLENDVKQLIFSLKKSIVGLDITDYNPYISSIEGTKMTRELLRRCIMYAFDIKEKSINLFNEDSEFLIYRPLEQEHELDTGWYILRGLTTEQKEDIMKMIGRDDIVNIPLECDHDYLVAKTTMNEQNQKSCFSAPKITDTTLFPGEKADMCFELINTISSAVENDN